MKVRFLFKKKGKASNEGLIYLALYLKDEVELISTGHRIHEKEWSNVDQYPKQHTSNVAQSINEIKSRVNKAVTRLEAKEEIITPFSVKQEFSRFEDAKLADKVKKDKKEKEGIRTVKSMANKWIANNLFSYQPSTQKAVKESINQFLDFLAKSGCGGIERQDINPELITSYERYLQDKKKLANSTHGKRIKHLRWFLKHINYDVAGIKIRNHRKDIISLAQDELEALEAIDVSKSSEQQKVKDIFLLGCYTGQRISELKRINQTHIIDGRICMTQKKTKREVTIPILSKTRAILERYDFKAPKISEQIVNREIKEICKDAGITKLLTIRKNVAGKDVDEQISKAKLISTHTASKTFISLAPDWYGLTPGEVASIVGKDLKTLLNHYYNLPRTSAIKKMESHD